MFAQLFPFSDNAPFWHPKSIANKISAQFPDSQISWKHANQKLQAELEELQKSGMPDPVITGHKNLFNNTVYIEVYCNRSKTAGIAFYAYIDSPIEAFALQNPPLEEERQLALAIANRLKYDIDFSLPC